MIGGASSTDTGGGAAKTDTDNGGTGTDTGGGTKDATKKPANDGKSDECKDKHVQGRPSDCPAMRSYCENVIYRDLMAQQCP